ncbi:MAG: imidazolonepropionase [Ignavibacteriae bacterium]|nr:imidazolonepropionase [Ignavibacteriota bacterium]
MAYLLKNISNLVTCAQQGKDKGARKGKNASEIGLIKNGNVITVNDRIVFAGGTSALKLYLLKNKIKNLSEIDAAGKTVMPGFIDSHTHLVFAGSRSDEYEMRIKGSSYEEIAKAGGGISSTVNKVRKASGGELTRAAEKRLGNFISYGTTTLEAKSGYGLDVKTELKMLEVINKLNKKNKYGIDIYPTFLGAHSVPKGICKEEYIEIICSEMIPAVAEGGLAKFIDVFCEKGYFSAKDSERILSTGARFGMIPKLHTDQFYSIGGIDTAIKVKAISVDHLEVLKSNDIKKLRKKNIIATLLPGASYFLDISYPPARELIANEIPVAIATDFNPGSSMTENMQIIMSLSSLKMKMSSEEIINAATINGAYALFIQDISGSIEPGKQADLLIFDFPSYNDLIYHYGVNQLEKVMKKGRFAN